MKILLINNNPVVSRLTALSARKEEIEIDEIQEVTELSSDHYDIVFVDADSLSKDVHDIISDTIQVQKKVLFYAQEDKEDKTEFDLTILKPFLPSEVSSIIRSVADNEVSSGVEEPAIEVSNDLLNEKPIEKKDNLFELDADFLTLPELEETATKDDLLDELKKVETLDDEKDFDQKLKEAFPLSSSELDDDLFDEVKDKVEVKTLPTKNEEDLFELDLNNDKLSLDDDLLALEPKNKDSSLDNELLDFDFENSNELDFDSEKVELNRDELSKEPIKEQSEVVNNIENKAETKILDASEISNIKDILEDDSQSSDMELSDLMSTTSPTVNLLEPEESPVAKRNETVEQPKKESEIPLETLAKLPVESLRKLLLGAKVNINIEFPKD